MHLTLNKKHSFWLAGAIATMLSTAGCNPLSVDPVADPNNADLTEVLNNPTSAQLNALAVGLEALLRLGHTNNAPYNQITGVQGREIIILASNEPRWYGEILGTKGALGNNSFYSAGSYNAFARINRAAEILRQSAKGANAAILDDSQKQGIYGYADTYEALGKLHLLNLMGENGIRVDVADFLNPGKFTAGSAPALASIRTLLDKAAGELANAGSSFAFSLSSGYNGFNTPTSFLKFNRALAARVSLYQKNYAAAQTALDASFYSQGGDLKVGPKLTFNPAVSGDQGNSYFQVPNTGPSTLVVVPDNFVNEADTIVVRRRRAPFALDSVVADARVTSKVSRRTAPRTLGGITGNYDPLVYPSQTSPLDIIRNEELILISAEVKANQGNVAGALADINAIRVRAGRVRPYGGATDLASLNDEILKQRRYSLFYEGYRWVDLRRFNRLSGLATVGTTTSLVVTPAKPPFSMIQTVSYATGRYKLFTSLAKPFAEQAWDDAHQ